MTEAIQRVRAGLARVGQAAAAHRGWVALGGVATSGAVALALVNRKRAAAIGEKVVAKLRGVLGTPYIWGGDDPSRGLDCSGAVVWALRELGLVPKKWDSSAAGMKKSASVVLVPQVGDLAFYKSSLFGDVSHVMVYAGDGRVIGATGGDSTTTSVAKANKKNAAVKFLPVNYRDGFAGFGRLPVQEVVETSVGALEMLGAG